MRDDYLKEALKKITDPMVLINVVSRRVKQLRRGARALVESLEKLTAEDIALREIMEDKISFELGADEIHVPVQRPVTIRHMRDLPVEAPPEKKKSAKVAVAVPTPVLTPQ